MRGAGKGGDFKGFKGCGMLRDDRKERENDILKEKVAGEVVHGGVRLEGKRFKIDAKRKSYKKKPKFSEEKIIKDLKGPTARKEKWGGGGPRLDHLAERGFWERRKSKTAKKGGVENKRAARWKKKKEKGEQSRETQKIKKESGSVGR